MAETRRDIPHPMRVRPIALLACVLLVLAVAPATARAPTETEKFAFNVLYKNYVIGERPRTSILDGSWNARCRQVKPARVPTATCWLSWDSDHAHWTASARFRGATRIGSKSYRRFTWRFHVKSRCVGDVCSTIEPKRRVKRYTWKGSGLNTPA